MFLCPRNLWFLMSSTNNYLTIIKFTPLFTCVLNFSVLFFFLLAFSSTSPIYFTFSLSSKTFSTPRVLNGWTSSRAGLYLWIWKSPGNQLHAVVRVVALQLRGAPLVVIILMLNLKKKLAWLQQFSQENNLLAWHDNIGWQWWVRLHIIKV